jgi:hypothetical protein
MGVTREHKTFTILPVLGTIESIVFDTITTDSGERYKVDSKDRHKIFTWDRGDSIEISGFSDVTVRNTTRFDDVKARRC